VVSEQGGEGAARDPLLHDKGPFCPLTVQPNAGVYRPLYPIVGQTGQALKDSAVEGNEAACLALCVSCDLEDFDANGAAT